MEDITVEMIEDEKYRLRMDALLERLREIIIEADFSVARGSTQKADKLLKKVENEIVDFIMGAEITMTDLKFIKKGSKNLPTTQK